MGKKTLWILVLVIAMLMSACAPDTTGEKPAQNTEQAAEQNTEESTGETTQIKTDFQVVVIHKDGTKKEWTLDTKEEYLGAALVSAGIVEAEENRFGMHIKKADGERAVFQEDSAYWAVYAGDDFATKSTDLTPVEGGKTYKLVYTQPVLEDAEEPSWYLLKHVYMPIARGQVGTDWDTVSAFFEKHGYSSKIDEGTYGIRDPYRGWSNFGGLLTNANGYNELATLEYTIYEGDDEKACAGVFCRGTKGENPSYRINISYLGMGSYDEVDSLKEVEDYIRSNG